MSLKVGLLGLLRCGDTVYQGNYDCTSDTHISAFQADRTVAVRARWYKKNKNSVKQHSFEFDSF